MPIFVNQVLLEHSHACHLHIICGCLLTTTAWLSNTERLQGLKLKNLLSGF